MEEDLQPRPHLLQILLSRQLHDPCQYGEHPRGHAADVGDVLMQCLLCDAFALHLKVRYERRLLFRHPHQIGQRVDILNQYGTEVAHQRVGQVIVRRVAAAQNQRLSVEESALGVVVQIIGHGILSPSVVYILQSVIADGNKLALVVGRTRRLRVPLHLSRPEDIPLSMSHPVDASLQFFVSIQGCRAHEILIATHGGKQVLPAIFRIAGSLDQSGEHLLLQQSCLPVIPLQFLQSRLKQFVDNTSQTHVFTSL